MLGCFLLAAVAKETGFFGRSEFRPPSKLGGSRETRCWRCFDGDHGWCRGDTSNVASMSSDSSFSLMTSSRGGDVDDAVVVVVDVGIGVSVRRYEMPESKLLLQCFRNADVSSGSLRRDLCC